MAYLDFSEFGGLQNTSGSGKSGDINLTTTGASSGDSYMIVLHCIKSYELSMATSGTKTFSLSIADAIEEAYELAGLEVKTGYDAETARRSLNIMFADWSNRGVNLWTIEQVSLDLVSGTSSYNLNSYDLDIVSAVIRQVDSNGTQTDLQITNIGRSEYLNIPNKASTGRPTQFFIDRQITPVLKVWPTPDSSSNI